MLLHANGLDAAIACLDDDIAARLLRVGENRTGIDAVAASEAAVVFPELSITGYSCGDLFFQPRLREAALACGASKWQMIKRIILPSALPGVMTGLILAMARGAGEVAPLMVTGVVKLAPSLPIDGEGPFIHLERKFMHLGFHIYDVGFQSPDSDAAQPMVFATTLLLILLVVVMNLTAILIRNRLRKKYAASSF